MRYTLIEARKRKKRKAPKLAGKVRAKGSAQEHGERISDGKSETDELTNESQVVSEVRRNDSGVILEVET